MFAKFKAVIGIFKRFGWQVVEDNKGEGISSQEEDVQDIVVEEKLDKPEDEEDIPEPEDEIALLSVIDHIAFTYVPTREFYLLSYLIFEHQGIRKLLRYCLPHTKPRLSI